MTRTPTEDDVLPLTKPIVGTSGKVYTELPIPKGTTIVISTFGYNLHVFSLSRRYFDGALIFCFVAGTRIYGVQTHASSDQSVGSE